MEITATQVADVMKTPGAVPAKPKTVLVVEDNAIIRHVVLPNIGGGLAAGGILVFAASFGEFALAQILGVAGDISAMLWNGVSNTPRLSR